MVGKGEADDGHPKDARSLHHHCESKGAFARGLPHDVKAIIDKVFPSGVTKDISAKTLLDQVHKFLIGHESEERNLIATTAELCESFKNQFRVCT